jgi:transcriptional regulator with XRE-family HTH domain
MIIKVGERITELRNKYNLTQHALAKELGVSRSSVNAWELGISTPSVERIVDISNYFHVTVDYLLGLDDKVNIDISSLSEEAKAAILKVIEIFLEKK